MVQIFNPNELKSRDLDRLKRYVNLLDFYQGKQWDGRPSRNEKQLTFNYARVVVDKLCSYLMSGINFGAEALNEEDIEKAVTARSMLNEVYQQNNLEQLDLETEIDCAVLGDGCFKVIWDASSGRVRVSAPDIQGIYAWWSPDDMSRIYRVASRYALNSEEAEVSYGLELPSRQSFLTEVWTEETFELWQDEKLLESKPNPYGFIPFVIYPNLREPKRFWGVSDLDEIMEPQRELNRALSQLSRILELSGNPIAVLENVEQSEDIAVRPGAVWNLPEDTRAYLLDLLQGGGVGLHINYVDLLYRTLHDIAEAPRAAFGGSGRDLSGIALEIELQPLLQRVWRKRLIRSVAYRKRSAMILRLLEKYRGQDFGKVDPSISFSPVLPRDLSVVVDNEQTMVQSGIHSRRKAMNELGVKDPEAEFERWCQERRQILEMNRDSSLKNGKQRQSERDALEE
ncbi:portal protein [Dehalococcoides mccartyi]|uniref:phage portal protein n=1 Tax=Dehalococcoides mccartyi TaxID=61435 RepID=UPI00098EB760|nr:phage portal protein [Dehalococcoides mccartyi]AQU02750.1 portal protein [Dehalococcoides mccartyi]AQU04077.1 portal protein [Dehalococcoides mccartyi]